jgi:cell shape-determining protein MreC
MTTLELENQRLKTEMEAMERRMERIEKLLSENKD